MEISNPQTLDHIIGANGNVLRVKVIEIGDWNMDTANLKALDVGIPYTNWRSISVLIRCDVGAPDSTKLQSLMTRSAAGLWEGWCMGSTAAGAEHILLYRLGGGTFDNTSYNDTPYNRGWVTIWYVE